MFFKKMCKHEWSKWSKVLPTGNHIYKAQVRICEKCNEVDHRYIRHWASGNSSEIEASAYNDEFFKAVNDLQE